MSAADIALRELPPADRYGWIKHDGRGLPIEGSTIVFVRWRDGKDDSHEAQGETAESWTRGKCNWWLWSEGSKNALDIVAFKIARGAA